MAIDVKSERTTNGGFTLTAHVKDWEFTKMIPGSIEREIIQAIASKFLEDNKRAILSLLNPETITEGVVKEVRLRMGMFVNEHLTETGSRTKVSCG